MDIERDLEFARKCVMVSNADIVTKTRVDETLKAIARQSVTDEDVKRAIHSIKEHIQLHRLRNYPQLNIGHALDLAITALQHQEGWISVDDETPYPEERVMICTETRHNGEAYKHIVTGMYENGTVWSEDSAFNWEDLDTYDEEQDDYLIPEGWYEYSLYREDGVNSIDDFVTHWKPLPEPPKESR